MGGGPPSGVSIGPAEPGHDEGKREADAEKPREVMDADVERVEAEDQGEHHHRFEPSGRERHQRIGVADPCQAGGKAGEERGDCHAGGERSERGRSQAAQRDPLERPEALRDEDADKDEAGRSKAPAGRRPAPSLPHGAPC